MAVDTLSSFCRWDVESTTRPETLFILDIFVAAYEWCWLGTATNVDESTDDCKEEYAPFVIVDDGIEAFVVVEPEDDEAAAAASNVGTKG